MLFCISARGFSRLEGPVYRVFLPAVGGVALIGLLQSLNPHPILWPRSMAPFTSYAYGTHQALVLWSSYLALLACAPQVFSNRASCRRFVRTVFAIGVIIAVVGILQRGQGNLAYYGLRAIRHGMPFGPYTNYDHAASLMVMSALMGCGLSMSYFLKLRLEPNVGRRSDLIAVQVLILFALAIVVSGIVDTGSRGGLNSVAITACIFSFAGTRFLSGKLTRWGVRFALGAATLAYVNWIRLHPELIGFAGKVFDQSTATRLSMFRSGWRMFLDFPVTGTGLGALMHSFRPYQERSVIGLVEHVHNDWLELLLQTGIAGLLCYASGILIMSIQAIRLWRSVPSREGRSLIGGALAAVAAFVIHGCVDFSFQIPANAMIFLAIAAFLGSVGFALSKPSEAELDVDPPAAMPLTKTRLVICIASLFMAGTALRPAIASWYVLKADGAAVAAQPYFLTKAISWDADPDHQYRLGLAYLIAAEQSPAARTILLRKALLHSGTALDQDPLKSRFRYLQACILWRLKRVDDAKRLLP